MRKERDSNMSGSETGSEDQGRQGRGGGPAGGTLYFCFFLRASITTGMNL